MTSGQDGGHLVEQVTGKIVDGPAHPALRMQMRAMAGDQVVRGSAVTDVQVLDHPEPGQRLQGPVDAGSVYRRVHRGHGPDHILGAEMASVLGQGRQHGPPRTGHPFAPGTQPGADLGHQPLGSERARDVGSETVTEVAVAKDLAGVAVSRGTIIWGTLGRPGHRPSVHACARSCPWRDSRHQRQSIRLTRAHDVARLSPDAAGR